MSRIVETAQKYWDKRSKVFSAYYIKPSLFDKIMRKGVYQRIAVAVKTCRDIQGASVLDIGSGPGLNSISLIKNALARNVTGIDFAGEMINFAQKATESEALVDKCNFILGNAIDYDFGDKRFDFSMALGVFDYTKNAEALIKRMSELTTQAFVISWPENGIRMWLRRRRYLCLLYHYTIEEIKNLHIKASIKPEELEVIKINGGWVTIARKKTMAKQEFENRTKRFFDIIIASALVILLWPLFIVVALFVLLYHGYPVFFQQARPGLRGHSFKIFKFRSMVDRRDCNGNLLSDEHRLTYFGRFLRKTSLDELPELFNVIKGDMSIVGPRPLLEKYMELYNSKHLRRHDLRPGITGWAQINGRNTLKWEEKFAMDVWYVDNRSMWLDMKIFCLTVYKVINREGISQPGQATCKEFTGEDEK